MKRSVLILAFFCLVLTEGKSEPTYLEKKLPAFISDYILAQLIIENESLEPSACSFMKDRKLRNYAIKKVRKRNNRRENLNIADYAFPQNKVISNLMKKHEGKAIYVDIWATWCGACRSEFDHYPGIIEQYGDDVEFVFLCVQSPQKTYLDVLANLEFSARHYFLSAGQTEELFVNYNVQGLPHYLFIKPDGIVLNDAYRPSNARKINELFAGF